MPARPARPSPVSCLHLSLRRHLALGRLHLAVDVLPLLASHGLRPDFRTLSLLLCRCLRHPVDGLPLARRVYSFLCITRLLRKPPPVPLANHLITFHFLRHRSVDAHRLFNRMPAPNLFSFNAMLAGYARLGLIQPARQLFDTMPYRDVVSWNTMIIALAHAGSYADAIGLYSQLRRSSFGYNAHTFSGILKACVRLREVDFARQIHTQALHVGFLSNLIICSSLVDAYAKCGSVDDARKLFDEMPTRDVLVWTTLVHAYASSGDLVSARRMFDEMPEKNSVSWTALIGGYTRYGYPFEALDLFKDMMKLGVMPDQFTFSSTLCASGAISSLKHGKQIHAHLLRSHFKPNAIVFSSLIDMYAKCGDLATGRRVFDLTDSSRRDSVLWNTMMSAVGQHGDGIEAFNMFEEMVRTGTKPDANTFIVLLTACSHSGLIEQGVELFFSMESHGVVLEEDHYVCLIDLFGRAGRFEEAAECLRKMPCQSSCQAWNALLGACRIHRNMQIGKVAAQRAIKLDPQCPTVYVHLSSLYAEVGMWENVEKIRHLMQENRVRKERASSWIEVDNVIQSFEALGQLQTSEG